MEDAESMPTTNGYICKFIYGSTTRTNPPLSSYMVLSDGELQLIPAPLLQNPPPSNSTTTLPDKSDLLTMPDDTATIHVNQSSNHIAILKDDTELLSTPDMTTIISPVSSNYIPRVVIETSTPMPRAQLKYPPEYESRKCLRARCVEKAQSYENLKKQTRRLKLRVDEVHKGKRKITKVRKQKLIVWAYFSKAE